MKKVFDGKPFKIIGFIIKAILVVCILLFMSVVCLQRFSNNKAAFFNYRIFAVVTGSMEPKYNIGDVLISKEVEPSEVKVGDAVSYLGNKYNYNGKIITHEVVSISKNQDGEYLFNTKGLNNLVEDPIVHEDQLYGVVKHKSNLLSFMYKSMNTPNGFVIFIILPLFYIIGSEIFIALMEKEEKRRSKKSA